MPSATIRRKQGLAHRRADLAIVVLLVLSALLLASAPLALDDSYSWVEHTTSEAGGQGVQGAWLARSGFVVFGLAVSWLAHRRGHRWLQPATALHVVFGACLVAVAAFSLRAWGEPASYDRTEDALHSVAATVMGFAFAFGVVAVAWRRRRHTARLRVLDVGAVAAATAIPLAMGAASDWSGALQRVMFAVAYVWYAGEDLDA